MANILETARDLGQGVYTQSENDNLLNAKAPIASPTFTGTPTINGSDIYREDNILGTVSQSGGVPTGAIIERGSNANGEYVKYADGTLICKTIKHVASSLNRDVTSPASFVDGAHNVATLASTVPFSSAGADRMVTNVYNNSNNTFRITWGAVSSNESIIVAIGRWF